MILCSGEALIDMLPTQTGDGLPAFAPHCGGAVFNTAIALGRLGAPTSLFTGLSDDFFGRMLARALGDSHVGHDLAAVVSRPTTLAFLTLTDGHAAYAFYDENSALRMLTEADLPVLTPDIAALFFGGISLMVEPCGTAFEALLHRGREGRAVILDPNIRPDFIADEAAYRARLERMIAASDILKLSDEDLRWLCGPGETADQARALLGRGPKLIAVTEGARGATGYTAQGRVFVPAPSVRVADTVGAGDTFNAGLIAALHRAGALNPRDIGGLPEALVRSALNLGVHAAAVTVSRPGANPPRAHELP